MEERFFFLQNSFVQKFRMHNWKIVLRCPVSCVVSNLFSKETGWALAAFCANEIIRRARTKPVNLFLQVVILWMLRFVRRLQTARFGIKSCTSKWSLCFCPNLGCDKSANLVSLIAKRCQIKLCLSPFVRSPQLTAAPRSQLCCVITIWNQLVYSLQAFNRFFFV